MSTNLETMIYDKTGSARPHIAMQSSEYWPENKRWCCYTFFSFPSYKAIAGYGTSPHSAYEAWRAGRNPC